MPSPEELAREDRRTAATMRLGPTKTHYDQSLVFSWDRNPRSSFKRLRRSRLPLFHRRQSHRNRRSQAALHRNLFPGRTVVPKTLIYAKDLATVH